jgi:hypothetical protein
MDDALTAAATRLKTRRRAPQLVHKWARLGAAINREASIFHRDQPRGLNFPEGLLCVDKV